MLYRTRGSGTLCLQLPDNYLKIELYDKTDGSLAGALPQVTSIGYDDTNHAWVVINNYDSANPWIFSCSLYDMYIYEADITPP